MRRHFRWDKKYLYWGVTAFCVIAASVLFIFLLKDFSVIGSALGAFFRLVAPFIWGLVITYLLTPLLKWLDGSCFSPLFARMFRKNKKGKDGKKLSRVLAVIITEIVLLFILTALVYLIIPQLYSSIETIVSSSPEYIEKIGAWIDKTLSDRPELEAYVSEALASVNTGLTDLLTKQVLPELGSVVSNLTSGVVVIFKGIYNLLIGIIVSVYILLNLENFKAGLLRLLYSIFSLEASEKIRSGLGFIDRTFMGFLTGKLLDSAIIGLICYIFCVLTRMPYALLISVIVGITNIVPFFGPIIGAIPCALIILLADPLKCLIYLIFTFVLQQIDGNVIGPKILGSSIGINGFWIIFAIIVGGGLFGFAGMLLGVPTFVVIYTLFGKLVSRKLKRSNLPVETASYVGLERIDPATGELIMEPSAEKPQEAPSSVGE